MRYFDDIIIHCSATIAGKDIKADTIRKWHMNDNGWDDCGYHYIIDLDGTIEEGRPLDIEGNHCHGHNKNSVGVCYIGGLDARRKPKDTRTPAQKKALARLIWQLTLKALNAGFGIPAVHGHRDYANKACPCFDAYKEYN